MTKPNPQKKSQIDKPLLFKPPTASLLISHRKPWLRKPPLQKMLLYLLETNITETETKATLAPTKLTALAASQKAAAKTRIKINQSLQVKALLLFYRTRLLLILLPLFLILKLAPKASDPPIDPPADQPSSAQSPDTVQPGDQASEHAPEVTLPDQASDTAESATDSQAGSGISGSTSSSNVADTTDQTPASELETETETEELVQIDFQTPAIQIAEQDTDQGKQVTVSDPTENPAKPLTNVLAFTTIPEIFRVGQEHKIKIKWKNEGNQEVQFNAYDTDGNGRLDYVEWTVAHLSAQTFDIIFISKAFELDQNLQIINDIYDTVATYDQVYATVPKTHYVRVTFETTLSSQNDITIYSKPGYNSAPGSAAAIAVYPVYTDADGNQTEGSLLVPTSDSANPTFDNIDHDGKYRILLSNLESPTDVFDLKVTGGSDLPALESQTLQSSDGVDIDYIVDPTKTWDGGGGGDINWSTGANWS